MADRDPARDLLAIVPARKGSRGLPGKHLRPLAGKPLVAHTIEAARGCRLVDSVVVTSDDDAVGRRAKALGARFIRRPAALATDDAAPGDAVRHVLETLADEGALPHTLAFLPPTAPLRTAAHLAECIERFRAEPRCRSAVSVFEESHPPFNAFTVEDGMLAPLFDWDVLARQRQELPAVYRSNGAIYLAERRVFLEHGSFYAPPTLAFVMAETDSVDINTEADFELAEFRMAGRR